jgi:3-hydroxyisobutyrate dehydrogenase-like beta-hydroxyacid dehydrogenase
MPEQATSIVRSSSDPDEHAADVAVLGIGRMGAAVVQRLAGSGLRVAVWNRTPEAAAGLSAERIHAFTDPVEAVRGVKVVITVLHNGAAVTNVLIGHGIIAELHPAACLVDLTTMDVQSSADVAAAAAASGISYVRGAVSGNPTVVRCGEATILVSGASGDLEEVTPLLRRIGSKVVPVGDGEQARVVKLAINSLLGVTMQALAEAVILAESSGVSRETLLDAIDDSVLASPFIRYKGAALRSRSYEPTFSTHDLRKDLDLATSQGHQVGAELPVTSLVLELLDRAAQAGYGELDFLSLLPPLQLASGQAPDIPTQ